MTRWAGSVSHGARRLTPGATAVEKDALLLPKDWHSDGSRRGIIYAHAAGQEAYHITSWAVPMALGGFFPVACGDNGDPANLSGTTSGPFNWGNDNAIARITDAYNYLTGALGCKAGKVGLFGGSMGAIQLLNWARQNLAKVACIGLSIPVLDANDIYVNNKYQPATIPAAYGLVSPAAIPAGTLLTHNPVNYAAGDLNGVPIRLWPSDDDPVASNTTAAQAFAASGVGDTISVVSVGAQGHNTTGLSADVVFEWMRLRLG